MVFASSGSRRSTDGLNRMGASSWTPAIFNPCFMLASRWFQNCPTITIFLKVPTARLATRRRSFGRLLPQLGHVLGGKLRSFAAEARGDVVGHGRNLGIGVGVAERRHRDGILWRMSLGPGNHDLRDVRCTGIVDCPGAGQCGERRDRAFTGPVMATG